MCIDLKTLQSVSNPSSANLNLNPYSNSANWLQHGRGTIYDPDTNIDTSTFGQVRGVNLDNSIATENAASTASATNSEPGKMQNWGYGLTALGGLSSLKSQNNYYDSLISNANANIGRTYDQINMVGKAGSQSANDAREQGRQVQSAQHAQMGATGFSSNSGSNAAIQSSTAGNAEENAQRIQYNTNLQEWGLTNQVNDYKAQIQNYNNAKKNAGLSTLLTTATSLASKYYGWGGVG